MDGERGEPGECEGTPRKQRIGAEGAGRGARRALGIDRENKRKGDIDGTFG